jgi:hypothetical protein
VFLSISIIDSSYDTNRLIIDSLTNRDSVDFRRTTSTLVVRREFVSIMRFSSEYFIREKVDRHRCLVYFQAKKSAHVIHVIK